MLGHSTEQPASLCDADQGTGDPLLHSGGQSPALALRQFSEFGHPRGPVLVLPADDQLLEARPGSFALLGL